MLEAIPNAEEAHSPHLAIKTAGLIPLAMLSCSRALHHRVRSIRKRPTVGDQRQAAAKGKPAQIAPAEEIDVKESAAGTIEQMPRQQEIIQRDGSFDAQLPMGVETPLSQNLRRSGGERSEDRLRQRIAFAAKRRQGICINPWHLRLSDLQVEIFEPSDEITRSRGYRIELGVPRFGLANRASTGAFERFAGVALGIVAERVARHLPGRVSNHLLKLKLRSNNLGEEEAVENQSNQDGSDQGKLEKAIARSCAGRCDIAQWVMNFCGYRRMLSGRKLNS